MLINLLKQKFIESAFCARHSCNYGETTMNKTDKTPSLDGHLQFNEGNNKKINKTEQINE